MWLSLLKKDGVYYVTYDSITYHLHRGVCVGGIFHLCHLLPPYRVEEEIEGFHIREFHAITRIGTLSLLQYRICTRQECAKTLNDLILIKHCNEKLKNEKICRIIDMMHAGEEARKHSSRACCSIIINSRD